MTYEEARQHIATLDSLSESDADIHIWLAALEDELHAVLSKSPKLLARFTTVRTHAETKLGATEGNETERKISLDVRASCVPIIKIVRARLASIPAPPNSLKEEVDAPFSRAF